MNNTSSAKILISQTNVVYEFICRYRECLKKKKQKKTKKKTILTLAIQPQSHRLTNHLSENSSLKQHLIIKHKNSTNQHTSSDIRKIIQL